MKHTHFLKLALNFSAMVLLLILIAMPFYFARNFSQVAGVKSDSPYLIVSQIEKFPGMFLSQIGDRYEISFTRQNPSQAYLSVMIVNNPTGQNRTYNLQASSGATLAFFGEDIDNLIKSTNVPSGASLPISLLSQGDSPSTQTVEFTINSK